MWLKFDTGMNRLGFAPEAASSLVPRLQDCAVVSELRLMSHLASADELDSPVTEEQFTRFREVEKAMQHPAVLLEILRDGKVMSVNVETG